MPRIAAILLASAWTIAHAADFYVAPNGNDSNPGTPSQPFATIEAARDAARQASTPPNAIVILPGEYFLAKPVEFDSRDNQLTIKASEPGKVILYGGRPVTNWRPDGDRFWSAGLPGVKEGAWDFRALVINGRMPERARLPESGTFLHRSKFDVPWMSSVGGGWARKPTQAELTTLEYDPKDIPPTLDVRNAEVRVYHMWDESLVGVSANDSERHVLTFSPPSQHPAGAFGVRKYVVFNTREGMTKPGQWYLDRTAGKVVYWPLPGEDMTKAKVVAPVLERIIAVIGTRQTPATKINLRGISLQATNTPLQPAGFSASAYDGALHIDFARECVFENLEISNVGGQAIQSRELEQCQIIGSHVHHAGACGILSSGSANLIAHDNIHDIGLYHPSAVAVSIGHEMRAGDETGFHLYRNQIHDTPYSGIIAGGGGHLIEENLIYRVMREMQDGGAIYGGMKKSILRGNIVRDVVKMGEGYGVSSYYLDEGAEDSIVERNVSIGVERPVHNHIARNLTIRDNVFIADRDMLLSFQRSANCTFTGNTLFAPGKIDFVQPGAITTWANNTVYRNGIDKNGQPQPFTIDDAMPLFTPPARRTAPYTVTRLGRPPVIDGDIGWDEWPQAMLPLDRDKQRGGASGAPIVARIGYDDRNLYVALNIAMFDVGKLQKGGKWAEDDGIEIAIAGAAGTYVLQAFPDHTLDSLTEEVATSDDAKRLGVAVDFAAKSFGTRMGGWRAEFSIPFDALGIQPAPGTKIPFNLAVFRAEDHVWRLLEGTLAETWKLDQAAVLQLK